MLPGPASQRGAGRAGREGTAAGAAEAKYAFLLLPCACGAAGGAGGGWPGGPGSAAPCTPCRPPARPGSWAPGPPPPLCAATMQQSAAAARAPSPQPAPSLPPASRARGRRLGRGAQPGVGTARALRANRPPARTASQKEFFPPFLCPPSFGEGKRGGRGEEGARHVPGRAVRSGATFLAPAPPAPALSRRGARAGAVAVFRGQGGGRGQARAPVSRGSPGAGGVAWGQLPARVRRPALTLSPFAGSLQPGQEETQFPF